MAWKLQPPRRAEYEPCLLPIRPSKRLSRRRRAIWARASRCAARCLHPAPHDRPVRVLRPDGPGRLAPGGGLDVRPHPHIGLATVTYLFEGEILHPDSLGVACSHPSRRRQLDDRRARHRAFGAHAASAARAGPPPCTACKTWVALPQARRSARAGFRHHAPMSCRKPRSAGVALRVIAGALLRRGVAGDRCSRRCSTPRRGWRRRRVRARAASTRSAAPTSSTASHRWTGRSIRARAPARVPAADTLLEGGPPRADAARRPAAGCAAPHVVELRVELEGAHRAGETGLETGRFGVVPGDPESFPCGRAQAGGQLSLGAGGSEAAFSKISAPGGQVNHSCLERVQT